MVETVDEDAHGLMVRRVLPGMVAVVMLAIFVVSAFAGGVDDGAPSDKGCVLGNTLVSCARPHEGRIRSLADPDGTCPAGTSPVSMAVVYCVEY